ncbi:uncharacterized protein LOC136750760 [Amia ocellicauda]|uniref:uncharacterized protein LOC136750760 n=1 Tax=Amia ocellicauda TaxID=2972642 RepID=UPI0034642BDF
MDVRGAVESGSEGSGGDYAMLWTVEEALERQTLQIGASACGATAVVDVLRALGLRAAPEDVERCVQTRLRRNEDPLPGYLLSRSRAGATHQQLLAGAEQVSGGRVLGRFFPLHPPRRVSLVPWLAGWIRGGAVPVATMNMQLAVPMGEEVPDAWHHQLIFGVSSNAVYMTNPLDVVSEAVVLRRLCSDSVLMVRREDVLTRLTAGAALSGLTPDLEDPRWAALDVEGQVRQMLREEECEEEEPRLAHIVIPAAYQSGVTLFALRDSEVGQELLLAPDLALK